MARSVEMTTDLNPRDEYLFHLTIIELMAAGMGVGVGILVFEQKFAMWLRIAGGILVPIVVIALVAVHVRGHTLVQWANLLIEHLMWPKRSVWTPELEDAPEPEPDDDVSQMLARMGGTAAPTPAAPKAEPKRERRRRGAPAKTQLLPLVPDLISDRMVTMPNGHRCGVLECTGRNLPMLAEEEHDVWDMQYHRFLLSLKHPIKIVRRIRPAKIAPYLELRRGRARRLRNGALRAIERYDVSFMESLATASNGAGATNPRTFVVVPAPNEIVDSDMQQSTLAMMRGAELKAKEPTHMQAAQGLDSRCDAIADQLFKLGIYAHRLNEEELTDMWHETLRPRSSSIQPLTSDALASSHSSVGEITASEGTAPAFVV